VEEWRHCRREAGKKGRKRGSRSGGEEWRRWRLEGETLALL
jgi:hypothetical protein